ncbi:MAG: hypothetical protein QM756_09295 [Polyangiaceae bacterium]
MKTALVGCWTALSVSISLVARAQSGPGASQAPPAQSLPSDAPEPVAPSALAPREHHGVYLRADWGGGYRTTTTTSADGSLQLHGVGPMFSLAMGGIVAKHWALCGEIMAETIVDPTLVTSRGSGRLKGTLLNFFGVGPSVTYYLMPANVHFGAALMLAEMGLSSKEHEVSASSGWGVGGAVRLGKDFWLGRDVGLGAMGQVAFASMPDAASLGDHVPRWSSATVSLGFQATYH